MGEPEEPIRLIFSAVESRETASATRTSMGSVESHQGWPDCLEVLSMQGLFSIGESSFPAEKAKAGAARRLTNIGLAED